MIYELWNARLLACRCSVRNPALCGGHGHTAPSVSIELCEGSVHCTSSHQACNAHMCCSHVGAAVLRASPAVLPLTPHQACSAQHAVLYMQVPLRSGPYQQCSLYEFVWLMSQYLSVLAGPWLTLISIDHKVAGATSGGGLRTVTGCSSSSSIKCNLCVTCVLYLQHECGL